MQIILHNLGEMGRIVARMQRKWNRKKREPDDSRTEHKRMMLHKSPIWLSVGLAPRHPSLFGLPSQGNPPGRCLDDA